MHVYAARAALRRQRFDQTTADRIDAGLNLMMVVLRITAPQSAACRAVLAHARNYDLPP